MDRWKKEELNNLKNEVKQLHPLLNALFKKMESVSEVDYTHGNQEFGADFVLTVKNQEFAETDYVGVIAKIGTIKQDQKDVERQIEECEIDRLNLDGKKILHLNEIWVVSSGPITGNAKQVIHNKYKNKSIRFIEQQRLSILIGVIVKSGVQENQATFLSCSPSIIFSPSLNCTPRMTSAKSLKPRSFLHRF